ncbi:MAG: recombination-associated protein RdgC [Myxococcales bacterium]|nr:recombination-associated protein RdgC [Polyangiaceae bacterium]MDW8248610.1 recombination-associated protein RdgC [Myxococcales bacterium]
MGLLKGSISYTKYYAEGELPKNYQDAFLESLHLRRFQPLTIDGEDEQRVGWVPVSRPLEMDVTFEYNEVFYNNYLNLTLRVDAWKFPGSLFKAAFAEAEKKFLAKKGREKLSKREKEDLKVLVGRKLRHQVIPTIRLIDLCWNLQEGIVRYWNQSPKGQDLLLELWEKTFPYIELIPANAHTTATRLDLPEARLRALTDLKPTSFHAV